MARAIDAVRPYLHWRIIVALVLVAAIMALLAVTLTEVRGDPSKWFWIAMLFSLLVGILTIGEPERIRRARIHKRPSMQFDEMYTTYFQSLPFPRALVEALWAELAYDLELDPLKLRPSDRFGVELRSGSQVLLDLDINIGLNYRLAERFRKYGLCRTERKLAQEMATLYDYVEWTCRIESENSAGKWPAQRPDRE